jgi:arabinan endo-1,5-alpha-L-arabinosidase
MFVSAGRYHDASYRICVGRSRRPEGTFVDREGRPLVEGHATTILRSGSRDRLYGPGHNGEIITDADGRTWMYYHCHVRDIGEGRPRPLMRQQILWASDGWPYFSGGKPAR